jgi:hypothetical protein
LELPSEQATFAKREWFAKEVSDDPAYFKNNIIELLG